MKIQYCNEDMILLFKSGEHSVTNQNVKKYGIPLLIEALFEKILNDDQDITPKKLLIKVKSSKKANDKKSLEDRDAKYKIQ